MSFDAVNNSDESTVPMNILIQDSPNPPSAEFSRVDQKAGFGLFCDYMKKTYSEKLKDPQWQKKRLEIMERDQFSCTNCGRKESTLAVHHAYYITGRDPWQYPAWPLRTVCEKCHKDSHTVDGEGYNEAEWETVIGWLTDSGHPASCDLWRLGAEVTQALQYLGATPAKSMPRLITYLQAFRESLEIASTKNEN